MDLHTVFHQIRVHEAHVERTAFKTKYGTYQFKVMPFGLCNAPATFQRTMDFVLQDLRGMLGTYVDDILTGTDTLEDMVFALREVYVRLAKQKLYANPEKCCFGQSEVEYCGLSYWEEWYSTTAEEFNGGPCVAAVAEFHGYEEFRRAMWFLPEICSGLCHGGYTTD